MQERQTSSPEQGRTARILIGASLHQRWKRRRYGQLAIGAVQSALEASTFLKQESFCWVSQFSTSSPIHRPWHQRPPRSRRPCTRARTHTSTPRLQLGQWLLSGCRQSLAEPPLHSTPHRLLQHPVRSHEHRLQAV